MRKNKKKQRRNTTLIVSKNDIGFVRLSRLLSTQVLRACSVSEARRNIAIHGPSCVILDFSVGKDDALGLYQELSKGFFGIISVGCLDTLEKLVAAD